MSRLKEEEKKGAGERISGTTPGRPAGAKVLADCVRTPRQPASCFVEASFKQDKEFAKVKAVGERRLVYRGEETVGRTGEEASTERVS